MNKELRKQTWKYFWQQKLTEISIFLGIVSSIVFIPLLMVKWTWFINISGWSGEYSSWGDSVLLLFGFVIVLIFISLVCFVLCMALGDWIKSNWKKAEKRAKKKLKERKK